MKYKVTINLLLMPLLASCGGAQAPTQPMDWHEPPALLEDDSGYITSIATATVPMTPPELREFLAGENSLIKYMEPVGSIAAPVERVPIEGTWPDEGARRRLVQRDGHQLLERSLKNELTDFRYQAFAFTSRAGWGVDHIYADWSLTPVENGTRFVWTYRVAPKSWLVTPILRRTRDKELRPFMQGAMDRMAKAARASVAAD